MARSRVASKLGDQGWSLGDAYGACTVVTMSPAVFLDRDGVLNELIRDPVSGEPESPLRVEDVSLLPGAANGARRLAEAGFELVCVSNQPAAAKGKVSVQQLLAIHQRVLELLELEGVRLRAWRLCLHHPDGQVPDLTRRCACRKPAPGMLLDAAAGLGLELSSSWMVGDTDADIAAGQAAGCRTLLIEASASAHKRLGLARADLTAADLNLGALSLLAEYSETFG
jgi:D-glycero-D-manno-heptose 1,7-bisphosphate phosphatase